MCQCVSTASLWRVYGACTAFALSVIVSIALSQRRQGAATATIALPRRSHYVHRRLHCVCVAFAVRLQCVCSAFAVRLQCVCSAFAVRLQCVCSAFAVRLQNDETTMQLRWVQTQQNGTQAASSLPPPLCVQALPTSSWLLNAYSLSICISSRFRMIQTLCTAFRDECVGGPQSVGEFGYRNGWTWTGGCSMVTIIVLCMSYSINTLPVTLISSVCHPTCSTSFSADWVH